MDFPVWFCPQHLQTQIHLSSGSCASTILSPECCFWTKMAPAWFRHWSCAFFFLHRYKAWGKKQENFQAVLNILLDGFHLGFVTSHNLIKQAPATVFWGHRSGLGEMKPFVQCPLTPECQTWNLDPDLPNSELLYFNVLRTGWQFHRLVCQN